MITLTSTIKFLLAVAVLVLLVVGRAEADRLYGNAYTPEYKRAYEQAQPSDLWLRPIYDSEFQQRGYIQRNMIDVGPDIIYDENFNVEGYVFE